MPEELCSHWIESKSKNTQRNLCLMLFHLLRQTWSGEDKQTPKKKKKNCVQKSWISTCTFMKPNNVVSWCEISRLCFLFSPVSRPVNFNSVYRLRQAFWIELSQRECQSHFSYFLLFSVLPSLTARAPWFPLVSPSVRLCQRSKRFSSLCRNSPLLSPRYLLILGHALLEEYESCLTALY